MTLKSSIDSELGVELASKCGISEYFRFSSPRASLSIPVGAFSGDITDTRDIVRAQTLSGKNISVKTGSRIVRSSWELLGLKSDDEATLVSILSEMASGLTARLELPDGRALLSRMMPSSAIKVRTRGLGEKRISFDLCHSPLDPDLLLAINFDSEMTSGGLLPDWCMLPVKIKSDEGVSNDVSESAIGTSCLKIESGALVLDAPLSEAVESLTAGFFYQPDYNGAPAADRTFIAWLDNDTRTLIDLTHCSNGMLRLRIGDSSDYLCASTVVPFSLFESGVWTHIAFSFTRAGYASIFIDGERVETQLSGSAEAIQSGIRASSLIIGASDLAGSQLSTGRYDALRLCSRYESGEFVAVPVDDLILA